MKNAFDRLIKIMLCAKEIISELEDMLRFLKLQRRKTGRNSVQKVWYNSKIASVIPEERTGEIFRVINS